MMDNALLAIVGAAIARGLVHLFLLFRLLRSQRRPVLVIWR